MHVRQVAVRSGRRRVPTPRAAELRPRPRVRAVVASAGAVLRERSALGVAEGGPFAA
ncbi:hypothetical protein [Sorangium sp. So ce145]|uniref:hypothetical protein n=1 Tax=Sorangium sp. So ce145 TaxID=3133285 RepID=UPI003F60C483